MAPKVIVTLARSGSSTTVTGTATRVRGTATLYRLIGGRLSTAASTSISSNGAFAFPPLALVKGGSYRVITTVDMSWAAGYVTFTD